MLTSYTDIAENTSHYDFCFVKQLTVKLMQVLTEQRLSANTASTVML